jgi:hypothetical protein
MEYKIIEEQDGKETYYSITGESGNRKFYRIGHYATKEIATKEAESFKKYEEIS